MSDLETVIDTGMIEQIHKTVVAAMEKNLYRPRIGRFVVQSAYGGFDIGNFTRGRRVLVHPNTIERYKLHLGKHIKLRDVPGAADGVDDVGFIYCQEVIHQRIHRNVEISFHYPWKQDDDGVYGASDQFGFELIDRKMRYDKPQRGQFTPEIFRWIYDRVQADFKAAP